MRGLRSMVSLALVLASPLVAQIDYEAILDGAQAGTVSTASGSATLTLNAAGDALAYAVKLVGLDLDGLRTPGDASDDVYALHFHLAPPVSTGPVVFGLIAPMHDLDDIVIDAAAGTISGIWETTDPTNFPPNTLADYLDDLAAGLLYFNVHTSSPAVEIRGQVLVAPGPRAGFVHTATAANVTNNYTVLDHPMLNGNPDAIVLVTQLLVDGRYNPHAIGVFYDDFRNSWAIFNQDLAAMPLGVTFNVQVVTPNPNAFVHTTTAGNVTGNYTYLAHPLLDDHADGIVLVTQNWNPGGGLGMYNDHEIGVFYGELSNSWAIFNQDLAAMPVGASFNVLVVTWDAHAFVHTATALNSGGGISYLSYTMLDSHPAAIVQVTHNFNPIGRVGMYNDLPVGAFYAFGGWHVCSEEFDADIPVGTSFNGFFTLDMIFWDGFESGSTSKWPLPSSPLLAAPADRR